MAAMHVKRQIVKESSTMAGDFITDTYCFDFL